VKPYIIYIPQSTLLKVYTVAENPKEAVKNINSGKCEVIVTNKIAVGKDNPTNWIFINKDNNEQEEYDQ
jgi:hypothetical protein